MTDVVRRAKRTKTRSSMTALEWSASHEPFSMLYWLTSHGQASDRKLRLFAAACCRRMALPPDERVMGALRAAEEFADRRVSLAQLRAAHQSVRDADSDHDFLAVSETANEVLLADFVASLASSAVWNSEEAEQSVFFPLFPFEGITREEAAQAAVVRHIFGNPLDPPPARMAWSATVEQLASALYDGADVAFALHDALLEAGAPGIAEHFCESVHPKGCYWLDLILGKT